MYQVLMFPEAYKTWVTSKKQKINTWLTLDKLCYDNAVCDVDTPAPTVAPKQFTSHLELQEQVKMYCRDPINYDTTEYG